MNRKQATLAITLGVLVAITAAMFLASPASAQIEYNNAMWVNGHYFTYDIAFGNVVSAEMDKDTQNKTTRYMDTTEIAATVNYTVSNVNLTAGSAMLVETILFTNISANHTIDPAATPYLARYLVNSTNSTLSRTAFLDDLIRETHGGLNLGDTFLTTANSSANYTLNTPVNEILPLITNTYTVDLNTNKMAPVGEAENKWILSPNVTDAVGATLTNNEKLVRVGFFYTPMAFADQPATFWLDMTLNFSEVNSIGLWAEYRGSVQNYMRFRDNQSYPVSDFVEGYTQDDLRWWSRLEVTYSKVNTWENARYDSANGLLIRYETQQMRWDGNFTYEYDIEGGGTETRNVVYDNVQPTKLAIHLKATNLALPSNLTAQIPGYPLLIMLVSLGIGIAIISWRVKKARKH